MSIQELKLREFLVESGNKFLSCPICGHQYDLQSHEGKIICIGIIPTILVNETDYQSCETNSVIYPITFLWVTVVCSGQCEETLRPQLIAKHVGTLREIITYFGQTSVVVAPMDRIDRNITQSIHDFFQTIITVQTIAKLNSLFSEWKTRPSLNLILPTIQNLINHVSETYQETIVSTLTQKVEKRMLREFRQLFESEEWHQMIESIAKDLNIVIPSKYLQLHVIKLEKTITFYEGRQLHV